MLKPLASMVKRCLSALSISIRVQHCSILKWAFVIESETLAQLIDKRFIQSQYDAAWQLRLDRWGRINWVDRHAKKEIILKKEPATSFWKRVMVRLASILPVEWLL